MAVREIEAAGKAEGLEIVKKRSDELGGMKELLGKVPERLHEIDSREMQREGESRCGDKGTVIVRSLREARTEESEKGGPERENRKRKASS